ncbi:uncharacterized protein EURHEDRAFT_447938 [Aspergillus ruber CBS 135680]|uniref:Phospholipase/carboxylesterase/thioesterase domain-containing protein n=1 Tax=Aspergillus ruber (strain CBS 135680) TaxID=1388766 RepID=A0A017SND5_ASPRC|nr:uncharacterized protein EURHEDRAFT_447938 [Aspergillus ruber CBS 135680]EYE98462.1 hypothetical protein EURHEDRAFT_447938 [Aspergillus ruber CBS 135680]
MPTKTPHLSDFPSHLTITITPPQSSASSSQSPPTPNILLLLHGLGDSAPSFTQLARALNLPETTVLTLQAPHPLPFDLPGFHWGDDVTFDNAGGLDMDAGFGRVMKTITEDVVKGVLVGKCGYRLREILVLGLGQGGMLGLSVAKELGLSSEGGDRWLSGVISVGAPYPLSGSTMVAAKNRTPVLLVSGRDSPAVTDNAVQRTKQLFEFVEGHRYARKGDTMPRSRDEMLPVMQFFARRLRSRQGVPEGSVELT